MAGINHRLGRAPGPTNRLNRALVERIRLRLEAEPDLSAEQLGPEIGVGTKTARRYLEAARQPDES